MNFIRCDGEHGVGWNEFVQNSTRASFYHRFEWRELNERCFGHETAYLAAVEANRIVGVLPMVRLSSSLFGNLACSMPFVNYGGPCGESDQIELMLLEESGAIASDWRVDYLEIRSQRRLDAQYPSAEHKVSMTIPLCADEDALLKAFTSSHRGELKRAYNKGFTTRRGPELIDDFYQVLSESWRDLGTPIYHVDYLKSVVRAFPNNTRVTVVYAADGQPAAGAIDGIHNDTLEGMWLGIRGAYKKQLVGYVLYWELIKSACREGYRAYHLGRSSKDSGGEQFKRKWNASARQLYWHYILRNQEGIPQLNVDNPKYSLAISAWRRLPVGLTQQIGPWIARSIP